MKKLLLFSIGILAAGLYNAADAQTTLFTTTNDFSLWTSDNGDTVSVDSTWSADSSTINGAGNTTAPGGSGTSGSLLITWANSVGSFNEIASAPSEGLAFVQALDPGAYNAGSGEIGTVAGSGDIYLDYSLPSTVSGNYFQLGVMLQYPGNGYYGPIFSSSTTDLGYQDNLGEEVYQATIPYTILAGTGYGFGFGIMYNSNFAPSSPFHVDDITVSAAPVPEPGTFALMSAGLAGLGILRRRKN
jgi:hypothetical protein